MKETALEFSIGGLPPLSARGCIQTLSAIPLGGLHRTINGALIFTGDTKARKYRSTIRGKDKAPPALGERRLPPSPSPPDSESTWHPHSISAKQRHHAARNLSTSSRSRSPSDR